MKYLAVVLVALALTGCNDQDSKLRHKYFMECLKVFEVEAPNMTSSAWSTMIDNCQMTASNQSYIRGSAK